MQKSFLIDKSFLNDRSKAWMRKYTDLQVTIATKEDDLFITKDIFRSKEFLKTPDNKIGEPSAVMFRRSIVDEIGFFRKDLNIVLDYKYWYRMLKKHKICILNKTLVKFRIHPAQATLLYLSTITNDSCIYYNILLKEYRSLLSKENIKTIRKKKLKYIIAKSKQQCKKLVIGFCKKYLPNIKITV